MKEEQSGKMVETDHGAYYYHPDHLGSSSVVTDVDGKFYESLEYFPFGETWIHNKVNREQESTPYKYTAKEQDKETGWYYYGERYLDVRLSRWISADPPLRTGEYLPKADDLDTDHDYYHHYANDEVSKLPGMGGVYNPINLDAYHYAGQNPVRLKDADGNYVMSYHPMDNFLSFCNDKMEYFSTLTGINYEMSSRYESNTFDKVAKILLTELTPAGLITRVGLGMNPYKHNKLKMTDRLKEAGVAVVTIGIVKYLKAGNRLYRMKGITDIDDFKNMKDGIPKINKLLDALDSAIKSKLAKIGANGILINDKRKNLRSGLKETFDKNEK